MQEESKASRALQEEDEVSQASQSGGDSQSGGASGDQNIAQQPDRPPLTDDELSSEPVTDIIRRLQGGLEASRSLQEGYKASRALQEDEVSQASQSGGASGDHDIAPQLDQPPLSNNGLSYEPVVDNIRRFQEADEVSKASLSEGDS